MGISCGSVSHGEARGLTKPGGVSVLHVLTFRLGRRTRLAVEPVLSASHALTGTSWAENSFGVPQLQ
jgi:hypothetical protein